MRITYRSALAAAAMGAVLGSLPGVTFTPAAWAQAASMGGIGSSETITVHARVMAVDQQSRQVTLAGADGKQVTFTAGPEVRNLAQVRPGDTVTATYRTAAVYVLAPRGTTLPQDSMTVGAARAPEGAMPAGAMGTRAVVTARVVGVDTTAHTISLVDPTGGIVRQVDVVTPQGQRALPMVKVGDTITAVISQGMLISVSP